MKSDIHPTYHPNAKVTCVCGNTWETGSTQSEINVEICSNCHPLFTGKQKLVDTAGRVDRFRARLSKKSDEPVKKKTKAKGSATTLTAERMEKTIKELIQEEREKSSKKTSEKKVSGKKAVAKKSEA